MKKLQDHSETSRRRFLNISLLAGFGMLFSGKAKARNRRLKKQEEKVRLITADGQILEVDKSHLPNFGKGTPISSEQFEEWKKGGNSTSCK